MAAPIKLLILEDRISDLKLVLRELSQAGFEVAYVRADSEADYVAQLDRDWDAILADYTMPQFTALRALQILQERERDIPFIVVTGSISEEAAADVIKRGADDYLLKDRLIRLPQAVSSALNAKHLRDEKRHAEIALRESELRFRRLAENAQDVISRFRYFPTRAYEFVSPSITTLTGFTPEEYYDNPRLGGKIVHPADREMVGRALRQGKQLPPIINRLVRKDGTIVWVENRVVLIFDDQDRLIASETITRDITERVEAEQELRRLNRALQTLTRCNEVMVRASDEAQLLQATCQIITEAGGYRFAWVGIPQADKDKRVLPVASAGVEEGYLDGIKVSWADNEYGQGPVGKAIRSGMPVISRDIQNDASFSPWREDALQRGYAAMIALPMIDGGGVIGTLNIFAPDVGAFDDKEIQFLKQLADDLTFGILALRERHERIRAEEARRESEARLRLIVANVPVILFAFDREEIITLIEGKGLDTLQIKPDEVTGKPLIDAFERGKLIAQNYRRALSGDSFTTILELANGRLFDVRYSPLLDARGEVSGVIGVAIDLTERLQAEEARRAAELLGEELEQEKQLSELKDRFVSMASHEFRTPLATILSSASLLEMAGDRLNDEKKLAHLSKIQRTVRNMNSLLEDILTLSKAEANKLDFNPTPLVLDTFCRELIEEVEQIVPKKHNFVFTSSGDCSSAAMDEKLLRQIVTNLLSNAAKYSPENSTVTLDLRCEDGQAIFRVSDKGIGIPEKDQPHLFEAFHRAANVGIVSGTGLGLAITNKAVAQHRGTISFETELNKGTTFTVALPLETEP